MVPPQLAQKMAVLSVDPPAPWAPGQIAAGRAHRPGSRRLGGVEAPGASPATGASCPDRRKYLEVRFRVSLPPPHAPAVQRGGGEWGATREWPRPGRPSASRHPGGSGELSRATWGWWGGGPGGGRWGGARARRRGGGAEGPTILLHGLQEGLPVQVRVEYRRLQHRDHQKR